MSHSAAPTSTNETAFAPSRLRGEPLLAKLKAFAADIKISHTLFALPWALLATFLAAGGSPRSGQLVLILLCMVTARTVAMASNRLLDARLDSLNPRTARRAIPSGTLSPRFVLVLLVLCCLGFITATFGFRILYDNPWPLVLAVPVLVFISVYPLLKRFTRLCHYYLGAALALAPVCAWIAIRGNVELTPLIMASTVLMWTAGFDIIYACQDYASDVQSGIFSVPAKVGVARALGIARLTHLGCATLLLTLGWHSPHLGTLYFTGAGIAIALLVIEHAIVKPHDLSKVNLAFFTINGIISLLLGTLGIIDVYIH
jgi:4-hydroxybenzoate polyprenyltransferase